MSQNSRFSALRIEGFRGIADLSLTDFSKVNILIGLNGVGKTSVLEACAAAANPMGPALIAQLGAWREMPNLNLTSDFAVRSIFPNVDVEREVKLTFTVDGREERLAMHGLQRGDGTVETTTSDPSAPSSSITPEQFRGMRYDYHPAGSKQLTSQLELTANGFTSKAASGPHGLGSYYVHARRSTSPGETSSVLTALYATKSEGPFIETLKRIDPRIEKIVPGSVRNQPVVLVDIGLPRLLPMNLLGDGFCRVCLIATGIASRGPQIVIVDEIDSGLHVSVMTTFWEAILSLLDQWPVQLFCSTHNEEMLQTTLTAFCDRKDALRIFRLDRGSDGKVSAQKYTYETFQEATKAGFDVR
jgi:hypothetical protein